MWQSTGIHNISQCSMILISTSHRSRGGRVCLEGKCVAYGHLNDYGKDICYENTCSVANTRSHKVNGVACMSRTLEYVWFRCFQDEQKLSEVKTILGDVETTELLNNMANVHTALRGNHRVTIRGLHETASAAPKGIQVSVAQDLLGTVENAVNFA